MLLITRLPVPVGSRPLMLLMAGASAPSTLPLRDTIVLVVVVVVVDAAAAGTAAAVVVVDRGDGLRRWDRVFQHG